MQVPFAINWDKVMGNKGAIVNEQVIKIKGMTCGHCEGRATTELLKISGVTAVVASSEKAIATITSNAPVDASAVDSAVREAGYSVLA